MHGQPAFVTRTALCRICIWPRCLVQVKSRVWKLGLAPWSRCVPVPAVCPGLLHGASVRAITPDGMRCTSRRRLVQKLPKTTCESCFEELTGTCFGANSFRGKPFCARDECWHRQCDESPVAESTSQFQNYKKFMSNQTTVTTPAPQTTPTPKPATPPPTGVNAPPRPAGDTGATPKPLAPAASTPATTNPPAATQAPKPPQQQMLPPAPGKTLGTGGRTAAISPQQQTVPPAPGKVRKPRSGRNH